MSATQLTAIFIKRAHGGVMDSKDSATLDERGIVGNANRGGFRPITIISIERWSELMKETHSDLGPEARRANLVLTGIDLENSRGRTLAIGGCRLLVGGETRPCEQMEEAAPGLQHAMGARWGGGAYATVVTAGRIAVGDPVDWV
jgi:MOSC domain-containing protein YiiM